MNLAHLYRITVGSLKALFALKTNLQLPRLRHGLLRHSLLSASLLVSALFLINPAEQVYADGGDFSLNLAAAESSTYDHATGGGAWNDGGQSNVSETLRAVGDNFLCGETISFLIEIVVSDSAIDTQSIDINMDFAKETTGQPGASYSSISNVEINYDPDLLSGEMVDSAIDDDTGSSVTWSVVDDGTLLNLAMTVDDLEAGETVIVRIDAVLSCEYKSSPTGSLQAGIDSANITGDVSDQITFGNETVPLNIKGIDTPILISSFDAYSNGNAGWIKWSTDWELGALRYKLERQINSADPEDGWQRVHDEEWLPFSILGANATYIVHDNSLSPGDFARYRIIEQAKQSDEPLIYGPLDVVVAETNKPQPKSGTVRPKRRAPLTKAEKQAKKEQNRLSQGEQNQLNSFLTAAADTGATPIIKIAVTEQGIQRISADALATQFGVTVKQASTWLKQGRFALSTDGQPVAWHEYQDNLIFYGEAIPQNHWNTARYYWLEADTAGQSMSRRALHAGGGDVLTDYEAIARYDVTTHGFAYEGAIIWPMRVLEDPYFFMGSFGNFSGTPYLHTFSIQADPNTANLSATLIMSGNVIFHFTTPGSENVLSLSINGEHVDEYVYLAPLDEVSGSTNFDFPFEIPGHFLEESNLEITVSAESPGDVFIYTNSYELRYRRAFVVNAASIQFTPDNPGSALITGFPDSESLVALKVTDPLQPVWLMSERYSGEVDATFETDEYVIASESGWHQPDLSLQQPAPVVNGNTDYLIVSAQSLLGGASDLANYRSDLVSSIVSIESIYDHTAWGNPNPETLKTFLKALPQKPRYVVLLGSGSLDYKDLLGYGGNLISPMLMDTGGFLKLKYALDIYFDDSQFADFDGDYRPDLSIGRIPAENPEELALYIEKLRNFESSGFSLPNVIATDRNIDFRAQGEILADHINGDVSTLHALDLGYAETSSQLFTQFDTGVSTVSYLGHSGTSGLTNRGWILNSDVAKTMTNTDLPIFVGLGCTTNNFAQNFNESGVFANAFLLDNEHGFIATFGSTIYSDTILALRMGLTLHEELETAERLGDAVLPAIANHDFVQFGYGLLGDPALKLR